MIHSHYQTQEAPFFYTSQPIANGDVDTLSIFRPSIVCHILIFLHIFLTTNSVQGIVRHLNEYNTDTVEENDEIIDESEIGQLPLEIRHNICSFMSSWDLVRLSQVSRTWHIMCNDDAHWKQAFDAEKIHWESIQC
jgi:F-box domain